MDLRDLPTLNTALNATTVVLLLLGYRAIKRKDIVVHRRYMVSAACVSAAFLTSYLIYHYAVGSVPYTGRGVRRAVYFFVLLTHTPLAAINVPLIVATLWLGYRDRREKHKKLAKITFPIWLYVSVTGIIVYLMLYVLPK